MRVAIVGLGPKGLYALERLLDHARGFDRSIQVDVFEPHHVPGAGPIYDPGQPEYLLMNFAAANIDMWWPGSGAVPPAERRSYVQWSGAELSTYPSRAAVGRYLADGLDRLLLHRPPGVSVQLHRSAVAAVSARGGLWAVTAGGETTVHDEVLVAIGHQPAPSPVPIASPVYPVQRWLSPDRIRPGSTVAVRGFALTFIDAALALTEGRGGVFEPLDDNGRLRYAPSKDDVGQIIPHSRTGRPMLAKPGPEVGASVPGLEPILESGRSRVQGLRRSTDAVTDLAAVVTATATAALAAAGRGDLTSPAGLDPRAQMERSLAVGAGHSRPDLAWALGQAWRGVYPAVVACFSGRRWIAGEARRFRRLSAELERVAFGPAPVNTAKILALIDAGRLNLRDLREPRRGRVDAVVDAVLPPPGALGLRSPLLEQLVRDGHARLVEGGRGLEVTADGGCVRRGGSPSSGLSAIGRPTEDSVIGNDTLSRTLHPQADRWAGGVLRRGHSRPAAAIAREQVA